MAKTVQDIALGGASVAQGSVVGKVPGDRKWKVCQITGDANYPAGGYPIAAADFGFAYQLDYLFIINDGSGPTGGPANVCWFWNRVTQKLQLIVVSTGVENASADMHLAQVDVIAVGF